MKNLTDACYELLGIPPTEQPANHYRLLGLSSFESNRQVIKNAADRRMAFVRQLASGPYTKLSQELLNLLAEARICLLNHVRREQYDEDLIRKSSLHFDEAQEVDSQEFIECTPSHSRDETMRGGYFEQRLSQLSPPTSTTGTVVDLAKPAEIAPPSASDETKCTATDLTECDSRNVTSHQQWVIGASPSCDIVVSNAYVSKRHCLLTRLNDGFLLQDLDSRNGTFVNGQRLTRSATVVRGDRISLGRKALMPWPKLSPLSEKSTSMQTLRIGRNSKNDVVIQDVTVSQHHAELRFSGERVTLTDLGSLNGTYLDGSRQRIENAVISGTGEVRFGRFRVPVALLLAN